LKATAITEFGAAEVLRVVDLPDPTPAGGQVAIDVECAGVNYAEVLRCRCIRPASTRYRDVAGESADVWEARSQRCVSPQPARCRRSVSQGAARASRRRYRTARSITTGSS